MHAIGHTVDCNASTNLRRGVAGGHVTAPIEALVDNVLIRRIGLQTRQGRSRPFTLHPAIVIDTNQTELLAIGKMELAIALRLHRRYRAAETFNECVSHDTHRPLRIQPDCRTCLR